MVRQRRRRGMELGWLETLILLIGYVTSLAIVGATGIYIGQRAIEQRLGEEERFVRFPVSVLGARQSGEREAEEPPLTFYEKLGKVEVPVSHGEPTARAASPRQDSTKAPHTMEVGAAVGAKTVGAAEEPAGASMLAAAGKSRAENVLPAEKRTAGVTALSADEKPGAEQVRGDANSSRTAQILGARVAEPERMIRSEKSVEARAGRSAPPAEAAVVRSHAGQAPRRVGPRSKMSGQDAVSGRAAAPVPLGVTPEAAATARSFTGGAAGEQRRTGPPRPERMARPTTLNKTRGVTPEAAATARLPPSSGNWSVQVNATKERALAERLVRRLDDHGYDAFIVEQTRAGSVWYRVRVGHLDTLEKANALVSDLKRREGISRAFVASD